MLRLNCRFSGVNLPDCFRLLYCLELCVWRAKSSRDTDAKLNNLSPNDLYSALGYCEYHMYLVFSICWSYQFLSLLCIRATVWRLPHMWCSPHRILIGLLLGYPLCWRHQPETWSWWGQRVAVGGTKYYVSLALLTCSVCTENFGICYGTSDEWACVTATL